MRNKNVVCCIIVVMGYALFGFSLPGRAQEEIFKTLELVRTYNSEEELRVVHPELFLKKKPIVDDGEYIHFIDPETGALLKQIEKAGEVEYTEEEIVQLSDPNNQEPVVKSAESYYTPDHSPAFLMKYEYDVIRYFLNGGGEPECNDKKITAYNHQGKVVTELPLDANVLVASPDNEFFIAYHNGEDGKVGQYVYFYNAAGTLLNTYEMKFIPMKYSANSKYAIGKNTASGEIYLFTNTGDFITKYEYGAKFGEYLFDVYVSENAEFLFFSMFVIDKAFLVSSEKEIVWERPSLRIADCRFNLNEGFLIIYVESEKGKFVETRKSIKIISLNSGKVSDSLEDVEVWQLGEDEITIRKEGGFYEYGIQ
ncbi:MAG: hypothetical protein GY801_07040 [bacterium]|nr:hypothetical protein [bacterium]